MTIMTLLLLCLLASSALAQTSANLVKNGSFEGAMRYWFVSKNSQVVRGDAASGEYYLQVPARYVQNLQRRVEPSIVCRRSGREPRKAPHAVIRCRRMANRSGVWITNLALAVRDRNAAIISIP